MYLNMKQVICILVIISFSCNNEVQNKTETKTEFEKNTIAEFVPESFDYDSLITIPQFFKNLTEKHTDNYILIDSSYFWFCIEHDLKIKDSLNINKYYTIKILHDLFTSQSAFDCSTGEILNIPYYWHWIEPNPRHSIYSAETNELLTELKPPKEFSRYNSFADIDRTPYLFLSDLVSNMPKYYDQSCDTFSTFGWCSEREMAFTALAKLMNFKGKVVATGNHSWSEFILPMTLNNNKTMCFLVLVDNTFNYVNWSVFDYEINTEWENDLGDSKIEQWYNKMTNSKNELNRIKNHIVSVKASQRIENKIVNYLKATYVNSQSVQDVPESYY